MAVGGALVASGQSHDGSALFGAGTGLVALFFVTVGALTSQLFSQRRKAAGTAGVVLGAAFVVRMIADASVDAGWLRWLSPLGWFEELQPFGGNRVLPLVPLALTPVVLGALSVWLVDRRDVGEGILRDRDTARTHPILLRNALRFSWRQSRGGLVAWGAALIVFGLVVGTLGKAVTDFLVSSPAAQKAVDQFGFGSLLSVPGFVATMYAYLALALAFYAVSAIHVLCEDEEEGRLDAVLATRITRVKWLGAHVGVTAVMAVIVAVDAAVATWLGVRLSSASLSFADAVVAALNVLPLVALPLGVAVLLYGCRPALTVPLTGGAVIVAYLMALLGPVLDLPGWVLDLSPFHHVSLAPAAPVQWEASLVMLAIAVISGLAGMAVFARRDLQ
jgi:ABC-2 type transport system permease protein